MYCALEQYRMYTWLLLTCAVAACAHALLWLSGRRTRMLLAGLPTYPTLPFIGNAHQIFGNSHHLFKQLLQITKMIEETGKPFTAWIGPRPIIVCTDPDDVKAITNAFVEKPYYYSFAKEYVGNGLVTAPSAIWKRSIKKLAGTFTANIVDAYQAVFSNQAAKLVEQLKGEVGKEPFDALNKYLAYTTLETICQTALGVPQVSGSIVTKEYYKAFNRTLELFIERGMNIFYHIDFLFSFSSTRKELVKCVNVLHTLSDKIITKRRKERMERKGNGKEDLHDNASENGRTKFRAFLEILLDLEEEDPTFTAEQVQSEVNTIIVGGQETVAITIFTTVLMLGCKPRIQEKLHDEIKEIFGDSKRAVQKEDLLQMRYCEAIISETLRLFPPVPVVMRDADRDLPLKSCTVPKGTGCAVNAWGAGRSQRLWGPDAEEYRPERWLDPGHSPNPASYLAFSYGKRACIGKRYAMSLMKTVLAHCIRELRFESEADKLQFKVDIALRAVSGHLLRVYHR